MSDPLSDFVGRWDLVSFEQLYDDGRTETPMGTNLSGFIRYTEDGDIICLFAPEERGPFESLGWEMTEEEKIRAFDSFSSYAGSYRVEGDTVIHQVELSLIPAMKGTEQVRYFRFPDPNTLVLEARISTGVAEPRTARLTWRRT